jgi:hypothetical protein
MWEFLKYLVLTNVGRILLASIIIIIGAILVNEFEYNAVFYAGLILFGCQFIYMTVYMIYNVVNEWFE